MNAYDEVMGALARRAAGAIGDRDERRLQRLQLDEIGEEFVRRGVGLRREELEAERRRVRGEDIANVHEPILDRAGRDGIMVAKTPRRQAPPPMRTPMTIKKRSYLCSSVFICG